MKEISDGIFLLVYAKECVTIKRNALAMKMQDYVHHSWRYGDESLHTFSVPGCFTVPTRLNKSSSPCRLL